MSKNQDFPHILDNNIRREKEDKVFDDETGKYHTGLLNGSLSGVEKAKGLQQLIDDEKRRIDSRKRSTGQISAAEQAKLELNKERNQRLEADYKKQLDDYNDQQKRYEEQKKDYEKKIAGINHEIVAATRQRDENTHEGSAEELRAQAAEKQQLGEKKEKRLKTGLKATAGVAAATLAGRTIYNAYKYNDALHDLHVAKQKLAAKKAERKRLSTGNQETAENKE